MKLLVASLHRVHKWAPDKVGCVFLRRSTRRNHLLLISPELPEALTRDKPLSQASPPPLQRSPLLRIRVALLLHHRRSLARSSQAVLAAAWAPKRPHYCSLQKACTMLGRGGLLRFRGGRSLKLKQEKGQEHLCLLWPLASLTSCLRGMKE